MIFDSAGNLYGTTTQGGVAGGCFGAGCGVVFKLSPAGGSWHEKVLYAFSGGDDGSNAGSGSPGGVLIFDPVGNLYGTTFAGRTGRLRHRLQAVAEERRHMERSRALLL